jgi:hypothetical protein
MMHESDVSQLFTGVARYILSCKHGDILPGYMIDTVDFLKKVKIYKCIDQCRLFYSASVRKGQKVVIFHLGTVASHA